MKIELAASKGKYGIAAIELHRIACQFVERNNQPSNHWSQKQNREGGSMASAKKTYLKEFFAPLH